MSDENERGSVDERRSDSEPNIERFSTILWDEAKAFAESLRAHAMSMKIVITSPRVFLRPMKER